MYRLDIIITLVNKKIAVKLDSYAVITAGAGGNRHFAVEIISSAAGRAVIGFIVDGKADTIRLYLVRNTVTILQRDALDSKKSASCKSRKRDDLVCHPERCP